MLKYWLFTLLSIFVSLNLCQAQITSEALRKHEARKAYSYRDWTKKPVFERIWAAPEFLVDYLRKDNELNGYPETPVSKKCDNLFLADLRQALEELPEPVKKQIRDHLVGIYTVSNLGTTGYTEILDEFEVNKTGFIVLDVDYLEKCANAWASWKEKSPFRNQGPCRIRATIEPKETDSRKQAIQFILTHEIGHLTGAVNHVHPDWFTGGDPKDFVFSKMSWMKQGDRVITKFERQFPLRKEIGYYRFEKSPLSSDKILDSYRQLKETDFSSLYAATNMWDDFAETYVIYVHTVLQEKPWKIEIFENNSWVDSFESSLLHEKGRFKKKFMDHFFGR
ncbi:MAG: hypothetical protein ABIG67_07825 [Pseudomonadota bacterium]